MTSTMDIVGNRVSALLLWNLKEMLLSVAIGGNYI